MSEIAGGIGGLLAGVILAWFVMLPLLHWYFPMSGRKPDKTFRAFYRGLALFGWERDRRKARRK